jgi:AcrR family transcriptional regulator
MTHVADVAGVSRQTVYNEFGSRQALVAAYLTREIENLVAEAERVVRANAHDPVAALRAAFGLFLTLASDEPVIRMIVSDTDSGQLVALLNQLGHAVALDRIAGLITEVWPQVDTSDATLLADAVVRLAISHAVSPTSDPETTTRDVTRLLRPLLVELIGGPNV